MGKTIYLDTPTYERLKKLAIGFQKPRHVIEYLLDSYDVYGPQQDGESLSEESESSKK